MGRPTDRGNTYALLRGLVWAHGVISVAKGGVALLLLPNALPVVLISAVQAFVSGILPILLQLPRGESKLYAAAALGLAALEIGLFFPFFLTFEFLPSAFLLITIFDLLLLVAVASAPLRPLSLPALLVAALALALFFERIRGEADVLIVASYFIALLVVMVTTLLVRLWNQRAQLAATLEETERLNRRLATASTRIMEQRRRENLATMTAGIAHEINNPITYLAGNMEFLQDHVDTLLRAADGSSGNGASPATEQELEEARREVPEIIHSFRSGVETISSVVRRLQETFRPDRRPSNIVNLRDSIQAAVSGAGIRSGSAYRAQIDVPADLAVIGDPADLYTVFVNIVKNAVEASGAGDDAGEIMVQGSERDDFVELSFCDSGSGIPAERMDRVFDPFYSDKEGHEGMGIGLALCKTILEQQGGSIRIESREGEYTCVYVSLAREGRSEAR